jgi:hypothetical protein
MVIVHCLGIQDSFRCLETFSTAQRFRSFSWKSMSIFCCTVAKSEHVSRVLLFFLSMLSLLLALQMNPLQYRRGCTRSGPPIDTTRCQRSLNWYIPSREIHWQVEGHVIVVHIIQWLHLWHERLWLRLIHLESHSYVSIWNDDHCARIFLKTRISVLYKG